MYKPHIAIIDDGVNEKLYKTGELKYNIEITPELHVSERLIMILFAVPWNNLCRYS